MEHQDKQTGVVAAILVATITSLAMLGFTAQVQAQEATSEGNYIPDDGGTARINQAGKLRLLSQHIPAMACVMLYSNDVENMTPMLTASINQYEAILNALRDGDPEMGIFGAETKPRILKYHNDLAAFWGPFRAASENIAAGKQVEESLIFISKENMALLELAKALVGEIRTKYSNPTEITESEALLIDLAGRQRMLTQKIAKESCGIETGNDALGSLEDLKKTSALFETTLQALANGMPMAGLAPPPTEQIRNSLQDALGGWQDTKAVLSGMTGKGSADGGSIKLLFDLLAAERGKMNTVTDLYSEYARTH